MFITTILHDIGNEVIRDVYQTAEDLYGRKPTLNEINKGVESRTMPGVRLGGWEKMFGNNPYKRMPRDPRK